jgi:hypothetical protein
MYPIPCRGYDRGHADIEKTEENPPKGATGTQQTLRHSQEEEAQDQHRESGGSAPGEDEKPPQTAQPPAATLSA